MNCTSLSEIVLPEHITHLENAVFRGCTALHTVTIPDSVKEFGWGVFNCCDNITVICNDSSVAARYCDAKNIPHRKA